MEKLIDSFLVSNGPDIDSNKNFIGSIFQFGRHLLQCVPMSSQKRMLCSRMWHGVGNESKYLNQFVKALLDFSDLWSFHVAKECCKNNCPEYEKPQ